MYYHAFAIYSGAWDSLNGYPEIKTYWWLDKLSYAFMLEAFVFVSGYVFGYQVRCKGEEKLKADSVIVGKFKRLMIPCLLFSIIYIAIFFDFTRPVHNIIYNIISGVGHMWFLPMLFWCFVGIWLIEKLQLGSRWVFPILIFLSIMPHISSPFRIGHAFSFLIYFYTGYYIQRSGCFPTIKRYNIAILVTASAFILSFLVFTMLFERLPDIIGEGRSLIADRYVVTVFRKVGRLLLSSTGIIMMMLIIWFINSKRKTPFPQSLIKISDLCMGVYLFQQFVLKYMYYHTNIPDMLNPYLLPWVGFLVALTISIMLAFGVKRTKIGKKII